MVDITFTGQALDDVDQIAEFIAKDAPHFAIIFVEKIFEKILPLREHPRLGRKVPEFNQQELRELIYGRYRIVYKLAGKNAIDIIAVHHSAQQLSDKSLYNL